jgi:hypothetical protein
MGAAYGDRASRAPGDGVMSTGATHSWGCKVAAHALGDLAARPAVEADVDFIAFLRLGRAPR